MYRRIKGWFAHLSLARKLTGISVVATVASLILACAVFFAYDYSSSRQRLVRDTGMLADVLGRNSTATLAFGDASSGPGHLGGIAQNTHIVSAMILSREGAPLARFNRDGSTQFAGTPSVPADAFETASPGMRSPQPAAAAAADRPRPGDHRRRVHRVRSARDLDAGGEPREDCGGRAVRHILAGARGRIPPPARHLGAAAAAHRNHQSRDTRRPLRRPRAARRRRRDRRAHRRVQQDAGRDPAARPHAARSTRRTSRTPSRCAPRSSAPPTSSWWRRATRRWPPAAPRASSWPT